MVANDKKEICKMAKKCLKYIKKGQWQKVF